MVARDPTENSVAHLLIQYAFTATSSVCPMERQDRDSPPSHPLCRKAKGQGHVPPGPLGPILVSASKTSSAHGGSPRCPVSPHPLVSSLISDTHTAVYSQVQHLARFACDLQKLDLRLTSTQLFAAPARPASCSNSLPTLNLDQVSNFYTVKIQNPFSAFPKQFPGGSQNNTNWASNP